METTGSRFGVIDASFPVPQLPALSIERVRGLVGPAFAIAMLGGIESLLSAVVADRVTPLFCAPSNSQRRLVQHFDEAVLAERQALLVGNFNHHR